MYTNYPIIIERTEDGYYAECPFVQGAYAQGETEEEVRNNLELVMKMTLEDMKERGEFNSAKQKQGFMPSITLSSLSLVM